MKRLFVGIAVLGAFIEVASAQVIVYGSIDGGIRNVTNTNAAGQSRLTLGSNGTHFANRIGFKGTEDLGGGLNANMVLETGFNSGTGVLDNSNNALFNRTASVGIGSSWGTVNLGRQYTVAFKTITPYDPFVWRYTGIAMTAQATAGVRFDNDIQYIGTFGGLTVRAEYALGEQAGSAGNGASQAAGATYASGPLSVGAAYTRRKPTPTFLDFTHYTLGGSYSFGPARLSVGYADQKQETATVDTTNKYAWAGVAYNATPTTSITGAYFNLRNSTGGASGKKDLYMIAATYVLSKRTNLYAELDRSKVGGTLVPASTQTAQTGVSFGINHLF